MAQAKTPTGPRKKKTPAKRKAKKVKAKAKSKQFGPPIDPKRGPEKWDVSDFGGGGRPRIKEAKIPEETRIPNIFDIFPTSSLPDLAKFAKTRIEKKNKEYERKTQAYARRKVKHK